MRLKTLSAVALLALGTLAFTQERVTKKEPTFDDTYGALGRAWSAQQYKRSLEHTRTLMDLIVRKREELLVAAFPDAPEGFELIVPRKPTAAGAGNPLAGIMGAVGSVVQRSYKGVGSERIDLTVTADSPLLSMFGMWLQNPALLGEGAELVKYGDLNAILQQESSRWVLQILIDDSLVEAKVQGRDDEFLLGVLDQAAVDRIAGALRQ